MDALSELLRVVKLNGALFFDARCAAPWCIRSPPSKEFGPYVAASGGHVIEFHLIAEGRGYVRVGDETTPLEAGDVVMLPHGDGHYMGNGAANDVLDATENIAALFSGPLEPVQLGGSGEATRLVCGYLVCEARLMQPVLAGLPRVVRVRLRGDAYGEALESMIRHALQQYGQAAPGSDVVVGRLAEVLFTEALRRHLLDAPREKTGWIACAADPAVGRALAALHQRPAHAWTLDELAREAGLSRSTLTERFARYLGQGPIAYLADWRLELAAEALRTTSRSVLQIAGEVGYDSEAAFNRAFRRRFESPPARYRQAWRERGRAKDGKHGAERGLLRSVI